MTPRQERYAEEYMIDLNATQAAIRAGFSARTASSQGERLLRNVEIQERIAKLRAAQTVRTNRTADDVLRRLWQIVEADVTRAFDHSGRPLPINQLPADLRAALASVKHGDTFEVRTNCRLKALELIGRHMAMFTDRTEVQAVGQVQIIQLPDNGRDAAAATAGSDEGAIADNGSAGISEAY